MTASSALLALSLLCMSPWCLEASMPSAHAGTQHLVAPGESWEALAERVQPGDEIILMPGRHKHAVFERLVGTKDAPITIRGLDPENPPVVQAARHGILIVDPKFIIIENVEITGASIAGIALRSLPERSPDAPAQPAALNEAYVQVRHVSITKIGPTGRRDAIEILGQDRVTIEDCSFEGWGGAGVAVLGSRNVSIEHCTFKAMPGHSQTEGVLMRAGTQHVSIEHCTFELNEQPAIVAGGKSDPATFQPAIPADAEPGSVYEARQIQVMRCVIRNARVPIVMQSADDVLVRSCTFVRPKSCLVMFDHKQGDPRLAASGRFIFGDNLVTWQSGDLSMYSFAPPSVDLRHLMWEQNLWWSDEPMEARERLGEFQGGLVSDQILDVDPKLDDELRPQESAAQMYGARAP